ncbi:putative dedicator of cytokinesis [Helianthus debilis subsp. tardiflorus]
MLCKFVTLFQAINSLKNVNSTALLQFLHPILNMLLHLIGNGGETLQVAAFRAMVNILTRYAILKSTAGVGCEAERNIFLVNYVDYAFDDFGGRQASVYPGLSTVWGSLARSKAKGYRVGQVYDDVLSMAWFYLKLIVKSMALEQTRLMYHNMPLGDHLDAKGLRNKPFPYYDELCFIFGKHRGNHRIVEDASDANRAVETYETCEYAGHMSKHKQLKVSVNDEANGHKGDAMAADDD